MLCGRCKKLMFLTAMGVCADCGGMTTSMSFKICEACSQKEHACQACRRKVRG